LPIDGWIRLLLSIGIYVIGYCVIVWFFLSNNYEKELVLGFISKKRIKDSTEKKEE
jgi:hypothetical protein